MNDGYYYLDFARTVTNKDVLNAKLTEISIDGTVDEKNNKVTYVTLNGMEKAKEDVEKLSKEAISLLDSFDNKNEFLNQLIEELITREK